jgi:hypothetical protein
MENKLNKAGNEAAIDIFIGDLFKIRPSQAPSSTGVDFFIMMNL